MEEKTLIEETGNQYGRLFVLGPSPAFRDNSGRMRRYWECKCDCGTIIERVEGVNLRKGNSLSCGCLQKEWASEWGKKAQKLSVASRLEKSKYQRENDIIPNWRKNDDGYIYCQRLYHPMSSKSGMLLQHWHKFWLYRNEANWVIQIKKLGATLHHLDGNRENNERENLQLRLPGKHPQGWTIETMIETLESMGYKVIKDNE